MNWQPTPTGSELKEKFAKATVTKGKKGYTWQATVKQFKLNNPRPKATVEECQAEAEEVINNHRSIKS